MLPDDELPKLLAAKPGVQRGRPPAPGAGGAAAKLPLEAEMDAGALPEPAPLAHLEEPDAR